MVQDLSFQLPFQLPTRRRVFRVAVLTDENGEAQPCYMRNWYGLGCTAEPDLRHHGLERLACMKKLGENNALKTLLSAG